MGQQDKEVNRPAKLTPAKILIVDDHPIVRHGLAQLIDDEPELSVCGSAANHSEALVALKTAGPDLVIVDLSLGDESGLDLVKTLHAEHVVGGLVDFFGEPGIPGVGSLAVTLPHLIVR